MVGRANEPEAERQKNFNVVVIDLLADLRTPRNVPLEGQFAPEITGGLVAGWRARVTKAQSSPQPSPGDFTLDRIQLEIWWMSGNQRRSFSLEGFRRGVILP